MSSTRDAHYDGVLGVPGAVVGDLHLGPRFVLVSVASCMAVALLVSWWRRCVRFRRLELSIAGPKSLPVIGNALSMVGINKDTALDVLLKLWGGRYDELSRFSLFNNLIVIATEPKHIRQVVSDRRLQDKPDFFYKNMSEFLGEGLVTANGELWKAHRTAVTPTFHAQVLDGYLDIFYAEAKDFVERIRPAVGRDMEYAGDVSISTANAVIQTLGCSTEEDKAGIEVMVSSYILKARHILGTRSLKPWLWPSIIFRHTQLGKEAAFMKQFMDNFNQSIIPRTFEALRKAPKDKLGGKQKRGRKTFVELMLEAQLGQRTDYTNNQIVEEVMTVFGAGLETTATALTFTLKLLSLFPDVQQRVYNEVRDVLGDGDWQITRKDLARLKYTERVIKESMRIFPAVPLVSRHVPVDIKLDGKTIPAGSVLIINIYGAHRNPRYYPDPLSFDPDRFLPEKVAERPRGSYLPFSAGPRNCVGQVYGMLQMKTVLATTLRAYKLLPADDGYTHPSQFPLSVAITLEFVGGARIRYEQRK